MRKPPPKNMVRDVKVRLRKARRSSYISEPTSLDRALLVKPGDVLTASAKAKLRRITAAVKKSTDRIARERDRLRELVGDLESIAWDCDEATEDLNRAADALSRYL